MTVIRLSQECSTLYDTNDCTPKLMSREVSKPEKKKDLPQKKYKDIYISP